MGHFGRVLGVPEGLGGFHFLSGGFEREGGFVLCHGVAAGLLLVADGSGVGEGGCKVRGESGGGGASRWADACG